jgi:hypothetical protein
LGLKNYINSNNIQLYDSMHIAADAAMEGLKNHYDESAVHKFHNSGR